MSSQRKLRKKCISRFCDILVIINDLVYPTIGPILDDFGTQQCEKEEFCCSGPDFRGSEKACPHHRSKEKFCWAGDEGMTMVYGFVTTGESWRMLSCVSDDKQDGCTIWYDG